MDAYTAVIKRVQHEQAFDTAGKPSEIVRVEYTVGQHGPFVERFTRPDFTGPKVQAAMQATIDTLRALGATSQQ